MRLLKSRETRRKSTFDCNYVFLMRVVCSSDSCSEVLTVVEKVALVFSKELSLFIVIIYLTQIVLILLKLLNRMCITFVKYEKET